MPHYHDYKPEWLDVLRRQDEILTLEALNAEGAYRLGGIMLRLAQQKYMKPAAFRIITSGQVTFSFLMDGTDMHNEWWMDKKLNTSRLSGVSSIRTMIEVAEGLRPAEPDFEITNNFALCGGCVPLRTPSGRLLGYALCSGLRHEEDHQLIADALAKYLGAQIPSLI